MNASESGDIRDAGAPGDRGRFRPLRAWPAWIVVALIIVTRLVPPRLEGGMSSYWMIAMFGPLIGCALALIWWLAASRATWKERVLGVAGLIVGLAAIVALAHPTMRGPGTMALTLPMGVAAFAVGAAVMARKGPALRTGMALLAAVAGFGFSLFWRNEGMTGDYVLDLRPRWAPTAEDALLAQREAAFAAPAEGLDAARISRAMADPQWPGFRGADRAACSRGPKIATNWAERPPRQLWKIPVGPAWSSFAVAGDLLFTQEQRGPMETVVCYDADTGRELWSRAIEGRFDDPMGGPGPRATPTLAQGGLFVMGATGKFLRLSPATGEVIWEQDVKAVSGREALPMWGFAASPLVTGALAIVYAGGPGDKGLLAFDVKDGTLRWSVAAGAESYSSPQLNTIAGEELVLMLTNEGLGFVDPSTGGERLNVPWKFNGYRALQPHVAEGGVIFVHTPMNAGTRAIRVARNGEELTAETVWHARNWRPDFTDCVIHRGHAYGVDGGFLTCVDVQTGERKWREGRYGKGQVLLLENSDLLLVAAEDGRVVLVPADPAAHAETGSFQALEGKTWNHPVVVGDRLYVRNAQEAAAFELALSGEGAVAARR